MDDLQERLGYRFKNVKLLQRALTHRSFGAEHNERLEFLGDSVLGLSIASELFRRLGHSSEGDLSRIRAHLVREETLHQLALGLDLGRSLRLGEGELRSGGASRPSILADAMEAVIGAIYLDGGFAVADGFVQHLFVPEFANQTADGAAWGKDPKTALQEWLQGGRMQLPVYTVTATHGALHQQVFDVNCEVAELELTEVGSGASRRAAEQDAARKMLARLRAAYGPHPTHKIRKGAAPPRTGA